MSKTWQKIGVAGGLRNSGDRWPLPREFLTGLFLTRGPETSSWKPWANIKVSIVCDEGFVPWKTLQFVVTLHTSQSQKWDKINTVVPWYPRGIDSRTPPTKRHKNPHSLSPLHIMSWGTSLVVQWLGVPLQGTQVWSLVRKLRSHKPSGTADKVKENTMVLHIIYALQTQVLFGESCKIFFFFFDPPLVEFTDIRLYSVLKFWRNRRVYLLKLMIISNKLQLANIKNSHWLWYNFVLKNFKTRTGKWGNGEIVNRFFFLTQWKLAGLPGVSWQNE